MRLMLKLQENESKFNEIKDNKKDQTQKHPNQENKTITKREKSKTTSTPQKPYIISQISKQKPKQPKTLCNNPRNYKSSKKDMTRQWMNVEGLSCKIFINFNQNNTASNSWNKSTRNRNRIKTV